MNDEDELGEMVDEVHDDVRKKVVSIISEVLEISIYQILFHRGIYRKQFFRSSQRYSMTVKEVN